MFDVDKYLAVIGHTGPVNTDLATLRAVQKRHLMSIPFDNAVYGAVDRGMAIWDEVDIDGDAMFDTIVTGGRGGICYELNGLFRLLLQGLGFDYRIFAGAIRQVNGAFGPDLEHIFGCVLLDGETWLVDVGIGAPCYSEPLRVCDEEQEQYGVRYRMTEEDGYRVVYRRPANGDWQVLYRFRPQFRDIGEWHDPDPALVEFPPDLIAPGTFIRSRGTATGQLVLTGRRFLRLDNGHEEVRVLVKQPDLDAAVDLILNGRG
ncbi:arylamine N-acetyltransferase [Micromonospora sp. NPDC049903]|uniref:Amide synthase n=1 Tax=Verrucosispora sp. TaxID=1871626 RepID=A0A894JQJ1_9ACTN|nr:amide synthase [Verrucosispora sp.]